MEFSEVLARLGEAAGIENHYWDNHGECHDTSPETTRALLKAFGIVAETYDEAWESLNHFWRDPWMSILPPVLVFRDGEPVAIPLREWEEKCGRRISWELVLEDGRRETGECVLSDLPHDDIAYFDNKRIFQRRLHLVSLPFGYHRFTVNGVTTRVIMTPRSCYVPAKLTEERVWGLMLQLYSLKTRTDWGIGDFSGLKLLVDRVAAAQGDAIGLNPLHSLFLDVPENASPYSPASRLFRNPLYLDVTAIADFAESEAAQSLAGSEEYRVAFQKASAADLVDYTAVTALKLPVLERLYTSFCKKHSAGPRADAFADFVADADGDLDGLALYQALAEHFGAHNWADWPKAFRHRDPSALAEFAASHAHRIGFFKYLQWQCALQFSAAATHAKGRGMAVGLYNDLAVSVDSTSADHWIHQSLFAGEARVGAPPDPFNEMGQNWGLIPLNPLRLRETAFEYFTELLRANMRYAGALRIDHVMGLTRLYIIPDGKKPTEGAYVRYPLDELLAIAALESQRAQCMVIGEDLGTVPAGFREKLGETAIFSSRVFYFERLETGFRRPADYPPLAAVSVSTHDLATLAGFWAGADITAKESIALFKDEKEEAGAKKIRAEDKRQLLLLLAEQGLLPAGLSPGDADGIAWTPALTAAVHALMASAPSTLFMVQMDDLIGQVNQANLPGSITEYPNWRRRLPKPLEEYAADPAFQEAIASLAHTRR
jgi:4-alpha-glucanotransferase